MEEYKFSINRVGKACYESNATLEYQISPPLQIISKN